MAKHNSHHYADGPSWPHLKSHHPCITPQQSTIDPFRSLITTYSPPDRNRQGAASHLSTERLQTNPKSNGVPSLLGTYEIIHQPDIHQKIPQKNYITNRPKMRSSFRNISSQYNKIGKSSPPSENYLTKSTRTFSPPLENFGPKFTRTSGPSENYITKFTRTISLIPPEVIVSAIATSYISVVESVGRFRQR